MIFVNALEQASLVSGFYTVAENVCNTTILKWCFGLPRPYVSSRTDYRKWRSLIRKWALMKTCHWSPFCISAYVLLYVKCDFLFFLLMSFPSVLRWCWENCVMDIFFDAQIFIFVYWLLLNTWDHWRVLDVLHLKMDFICDCRV